MLTPCDPHQNTLEDELTRKAELSCRTSKPFKPDSQEYNEADHSRPERPVKHNDSLGLVINLKRLARQLRLGLELDVKILMH